MAKKYTKKMDTSPAKKRPRELDRGKIAMYTRLMNGKKSRDVIRKQRITKSRQSRRSSFVKEKCFNNFFLEEDIKDQVALKLVEHKKGFSSNKKIKLTTFGNLKEKVKRQKRKVIDPNQIYNYMKDTQSLRLKMEVEEPRKKRAKSGKIKHSRSIIKENIEKIKKLEMERARKLEEAKLATKSKKLLRKKRGMKRAKKEDRKLYTPVKKEKEEREVQRKQNLRKSKSKSKIKKQVKRSLSTTNKRAKPLDIPKPKARAINKPIQEPKTAKKPRKLTKSKSRLGVKTGVKTTPKHYKQPAKPSKGYIPGALNRIKNNSKNSKSLDLTKTRPKRKNIVKTSCQSCRYAIQNGGSSQDCIVHYSQNYGKFQSGGASGIFPDRFSKYL